MSRVGRMVDRLRYEARPQVKKSDGEWPESLRILLTEAADRLAAAEKVIEAARVWATEQGDHSDCKRKDCDVRALQEAYVGYRKAYSDER